MGHALHLRLVSHHIHKERSCCITVDAAEIEHLFSHKSIKQFLPRKRFTDTDRTLIWNRWQHGESLHQIAQRLSARHSSVRQLLARTGGIRPLSRYRCVRVLTLAEREDISGSVALGWSLRSIAEELHRAPSTVSREIQRNVGRE